MKKYFLTSVILFTTFNSFSQNIKYGIKAGLNISNVSGYGYGYGGIGGSLTTFEAGGVANIFVANIFFIEPELLLSGKGTGRNNFNPLRLYYIEIPVNIEFKERIETSNLFFGFGPYLGIGIAGKIPKENYNNGQYTTTYDNIKFGNTANDDFKRTDFGINLKAGIQLDMGFFVSLNYSLGLMNINPNVNYYSAKNRYLGISVGYMFGNHKK